MPLRFEIRSMPDGRPLLNGAVRLGNEATYEFRGTRSRLRLEVSDDGSTSKVSISTNGYTKALKTLIHGDEFEIREGRDRVNVIHE